MEGQRGEEEREAVSKQEWEKQRQRERNKLHREKKTHIMEQGKEMKRSCKGKNSDREQMGWKQKDKRCGGGWWRGETRASYLINYFHY